MNDFQQANRFSVAKNYSQAIEFFLRHAESCPSEAAHAFAGAAECYLRSNVMSNPEECAPGAKLVSQGDRKNAEKCFRLALQADPHNFRALWGLSKLLPAHSSERLEMLERSVQVQETTLNLVELGDYYRSDLENHDRAYAIYMRAVELSPRDQTAYLRLNDICRRLGRSDEAKLWSLRWNEAKKKKRRVDEKR